MGGRIIAAAAALLIVVTAGFATGQIVVTKLIGIGMAVCNATCGWKPRQTLRRPGSLR